MAESSILPLLIACSILSTILTTSCQSSNVDVVICGLVETFQQPGNLGSAQKHAAPPLPICGITRCLEEKMMNLKPFCLLFDSSLAVQQTNTYRGNSAIKVQCLLLFFFYTSSVPSLLLLFHADTSGRKL
jgi:hypothetical protein